MSLDEEGFNKLTKLCRIECSEGEKEQLFANIVKILSHVSLLEELATENVEPCYQVLESSSNVLRVDKAGETLCREDFLANGSHIGGMIKIPPVLKPST